MAKKSWTSTMLDKLQREYPTKKTRVLAKELGKTPEAVTSKAKTLKIKKKIHSNNPYTPEKLDYLLKHYENTKNETLAKTLGVSEGSIVAKAFKLKLRKSKVFMKHHAEKGQFKKGHTPANKGKRQTDYMTSEAINRTMATRFKKGHITHNTRADGAITIRKEQGSEKEYQYIRIAKGNWKLLHRYLWEQENGPVPDGFCLWFKDGNSLNCTLSNLELITRAENINRNWHNRYPNSLKNSIKKLNKLNKVIKEKSNGKIKS